MTNRSFALLFLSILIIGCQSIWQPNLSKVDLVSQPSENIVVINIGDANRKNIAQIIEKVIDADPCTIGLDIFFKTEKSKTEDSLLRDALNKGENVVILNRDKISAESFKIIEENPPYQFLLNKKIKTGYAVSFTSGYSRELWFYSPFRTFGNTEKYHISYLLAEFYDKLAAQSYMAEYKKSQTKYSPINYRRDASLFPTIDYEAIDSICSTLLENKIVLLGYTGPSEEDKKYTPLRFELGIENGPDTYGIYVVANIIEQILSEGRKIQAEKKQYLP